MVDKDHKNPGDAIAETSHFRSSVGMPRRATSRSTTRRQRVDARLLSAATTNDAGRRAPPSLVRRRIAYAISATVRRSAKRSNENDNPSSSRSSSHVPGAPPPPPLCCYSTDVEIERETERGKREREREREETGGAVTCVGINVVLHQQSGSCLCNWTEFVLGLNVAFFTREGLQLCSRIEKVSISGDILCRTVAAEAASAKELATDLTRSDIRWVITVKDFYYRCSMSVFLNKQLLHEWKGEKNLAIMFCENLILD